MWHHIRHPCRLLKISPTINCSFFHPQIFLLPFLLVGGVGFNSFFLFIRFHFFRVEHHLFHSFLKKFHISECSDFSTDFEVSPFHLVRGVPQTLVGHKKRKWLANTVIILFTQLPLFLSIFGTLLPC